MSISFLNDLGGLFCHILINFYCSDCLTDHQKLNIIQKQAFYFLVTQGAYFHISGWLLLLGSLSQSSEVECNPKTRHFIFWWLRGPFFAFWLTFVAWITQPIIRSWTCNPKMSISFFDDLGGLSFTFWFNFHAAQIDLADHQKLNIIQMSKHFHFLRWLRGPFLCILVWQS